MYLVLGRGRRRDVIVDVTLYLVVPCVAFVAGTASGRVMLTHIFIYENNLYPLPAHEMCGGGRGGGSKSSGNCAGKCMPYARIDIRCPRHRPTFMCDARRPHEVTLKVNTSCTFCLPASWVTNQPNGHPLHATAAEPLSFPVWLLTQPSPDWSIYL